MKKSPSFFSLDASAQAAYGRGDLARAYALWHESLATATPVQRIGALADLAKVCNQRGKSTRALDFIAQAERLLPRLSRTTDDADLADVTHTKTALLIESGKALGVLGQFGAARASLNAARRWCERTRDRDGVKIAMLNLGSVEIEAHEYQRAIELFQSMLPIVRDRYDKALLWLNLGVAIWEQASASRDSRKANAAAKYWRRGLAIARHLKRPDVSVWLYHNLGLYEQHLGSARRAIEHYLKTIRLATRLDNLHANAMACSGLASVLRRQDALARADSAARQAIRRFSALDDLHGLAEAHYVRGLVNLDRGRPKIAHKMLAAALRLAQRDLRNRQGRYRHDVALAQLLPWKLALAEAAIRLGKRITGAILR